MFHPATLASLALLLVPAAALAQAEPEETESAPAATVPEELSPEGPAQGPPVGELQFRLDGFYEHTFEADLNDEAGSVSIDRVRGGFEIGSWINRRLRLSFGFESEISSYDFSGAGNVVPGADTPLEEAYSYRFNTTGLYVINETWTLLGTFSVRTEFEDAASIGDGFSFTGLVGADVRLHPAFSLRFGVGARTRLEDDPWVLPLIGFVWDVSDRVQLRSENGLGLLLEAEITETLDFRFGGQLEIREYRLREGRPLIGEGVVADLRVPVWAGVAWRPAEGLSVEVEGGVVAYQEYEFQNSGGAELQDFETDPAGFVRVRVAYSF